MENNNSFWQTTKGKSLIKLGAWLIFIAILVIVVIFTERGNANYTPSTNPDETKAENSVYDFTNYDEMIKKLQEGNYEYKYTITSNDSKTIFSGIKSNGKEIGFKEDVTGIIKYYIDGTGAYQVNLDAINPTTNLYANIDTSYIDLTLLFTNLNEYLYTVTKNGETRTISYDKEGYQVTVLTDTKNITNINVTVDATTYTLEFTRVGECATIDFTI